jgi:hypothetical protein
VYSVVSSEAPMAGGLGRVVPCTSSVGILVAVPSPFIMPATYGIYHGIRGLRSKRNALPISILRLPTRFVLAPLVAMLEVGVGHNANLLKFSDTCPVAPAFIPVVHC